MEPGKIVELSIRAAVRRKETVINNLKPYIGNVRYQSKSPINGLVVFGVASEVANHLMKTLEIFKTDDKKTLTIPKHLSASGPTQPNNIVHVACIVKLGREKKLLVKGKKIGLSVKAEETLKEKKRVGKVTFSFPTSNPRNGESLVGLINSQEKIERVAIPVK